MQRTREEWRTVFLICSGIAFFGAVVFGVLADGELQSWASPDPIEVTIDVTGGSATQEKTTHVEDESSEEKITLDVLTPESNDKQDMESDRGGNGVTLDNDEKKSETKGEDDPGLE